MALDKKTARAYGVLSGVALTKAFLIYVGFILGRAVDRKLNTFPLGMVSGMILASVLGLVWLFFLLKRLK